MEAGDEMSYDDDDEEPSNEQSRMELDSHANMSVVGRHVYVISDTGRIADVSTFTPDYNSIKIEKVDAEIQYNCPYNRMSHILIVRNALHVPSIKNNLILPFVMQEVGIEVNDVPKIQ
eukprot:6688930-Ditylum_brightwellii.AAC.1